MVIQLLDMTWKSGALIWSIRMENVNMQSEAILDIFLCGNKSMHHLLP
jgi:hypothetical protein